MAALNARQHLAGKCPHIPKRVQAAERGSNFRNG
jgi:hypothetical protein